MDENKLSRLLDENVKITHHQKLKVMSAFSQVQLKRNEYLLRESCKCDFIAFVEKGLLVYYKISEKGEEITTDFAQEGDWVTDNYSRLTGEDSKMNIKSIEDADLLVIKNDILEKLYKEAPGLERLGRILTEAAFVKFIQLSIDLQMLPAKERYLKMMKENPTIIQRLSLHHIADYLGIAPKSLSRLRKEVIRKR